MNTTGNHELMAKSYTLFEKCISGSGKLSINKAIKSTVHRLNEDHGLEQDEILHRLFEDYVEKESFKKHDPAKPQLSTFVAHHVHYDVRNLKRKYDWFKKNYEVIPFEEWPKGSIKRTEDSKKIPYDEQIAALGAVENNTPEDYFMAKELLELIRNHYGEDDAKVLLGLMDRKAEAKRLSLAYDTYRKRLDRKTCDFRKVLKRTGYC